MYLWVVIVLLALVAVGTVASIVVSSLCAVGKLGVARTPAPAVAVTLPSVTDVSTPPEATRLQMKTAKGVSVAFDVRYQTASIRVLMDPFGLSPCNIEVVDATPGSVLSGQMTDVDLIPGAQILNLTLTSASGVPSNILVLVTLVIPALQLTKAHLVAHDGSVFDFEVVPFVYAYRTVLNFTPFGKGPVSWVTESASPQFTSIDVNSIPLATGTQDVSIRLSLVHYSDVDVTYTFSLVLLTAQTNVELTSIACDQFTQSDVNPSQRAYTQTVPFSTSAISGLVIVPEHSDAAITDYPSAFNLNVGDNTIEFTITAEDGITAAQYTLVITRESNPPPSS